MVEAGKLGGEYTADLHEYIIALIDKKPWTDYIYSDATGKQTYHHMVDGRSLTLTIESTKLVEEELFFLAEDDTYFQRWRLDVECRDFEILFTDARIVDIATKYTTGHDDGPNLFISGNLVRLCQYLEVGKITFKELIEESYDPTDPNRLDEDDRVEAILAYS